MKRPAGEMTIKIAERLSSKLALDFPHLDVFYDHGQSGSPKICQPTTYMGRRYGDDATLSGVDIVVVKNKKVILAVEVEEGKVRPKTVLGDVFGVALADSMRIQGERYAIDAITLIIAVRYDGRGKQGEKYARLERLLDRHFHTNPCAALAKVRVLTCSSNDLFRRIERLLRLEVGKHARER